MTHPGAARPADGYVARFRELEQARVVAAPRDREVAARELDRGTVSGFESVLRAKDDSNIPVLISASVLLDEEGREVGTVGFATDLRERKREQDALQKAYDELEKRVEERTAELKEARGRLQYLLTVTPGIPALLDDPLVERQVHD